MATLDEWEQKLRSQMRDIQLVGELELTPDQIRALGQQIAAFVHALGPQKAVAALPVRYPVCLAAFLVFQGGNSYHSNEKGDFWPGVCQAVGIPYSPNYTLA
ncbi:MAG: hypothetical protein N2204_09040, partial [Anaerolineae bacterium]|nr:hypothetical protein [Anaerolineae bacterium]